MRNFAALLLVAAGAANAPSTEEFLVADVATANVVETSTRYAPKGSQNALVGVDPVTKGPTAYSKTPAGTGRPARSHSFAEYTMIIAGRGTLMIAGEATHTAPG